MDPKVYELLEKARATAMNAATAAGKAADSATKMAGELFEVTKLNLQVFDLNTDIELLYKEIGKIVYLTHTGAEVDADEISAKIAVIDEKQAAIKELKHQVELRKNLIKCPGCGKDCDRSDLYCKNCGAAISE